MSEIKGVSIEVARGQLQKFLDYYLIESELVNESSREAFDTSCDRMISAIKNGRLEINDQDGISIIQHLISPPGDVSTVTYGVLTGHAKVAMKSKSEKDNYGRMYTVLGSLSGMGEGGIVALKGADLGLAECIGMLFMQV
jgi:hypothetical protein